MKKQTYTDPEGDTVLAKFVKPYDKLRDQIALRIERLWRDEEARLAKVKAETVAQIEKLRAASAEAAGVPDLGGKKGNIQFRSFDGRVTVALDRQYRTEFDERLRIAQDLILQAVAEMTETADADLAEIARKAFTPRKSGNLDMQRIRDLRHYNVRHPKWKQACDIIADCERTIGHRDYIRVLVRQASDSTPTPIHLDIAAL